MGLTESQKLSCRLRHLQASDRATVDPPWLGPRRASKSPPRVLTTPRLATPPARAPPSHPISSRLGPPQSLRQTLNLFPHRSVHLHAIDVHLQLQLLHGLAGLSDLGHVVGHGCSRKGVKRLAGVWTGGWNILDPPGSSEKGWCDPVTGEVVGTMSERDPRDR